MTEVIWFGSWPQGKALPHSDIDVAILPARRLLQSAWAACKKQWMSCPRFSRSTSWISTLQVPPYVKKSSNMGNVCDRPSRGVRSSDCAVTRGIESAGKPDGDGYVSDRSWRVKSWVISGHRQRTTSGEGTS